MTFGLRNIIILTIVLGLLILAAAILVDPYFFSSPKTLYEIGQSEMKNGRDYDLIHPDKLRQATTYFRLAIDKGLKEREIFYKTFWCYHDLNDYSKAETILTEALEIYPTDIEFLYWRGQKRKEQKKYQLALEDFDSVIQLDSVSYELIYSAYYDRGAMKYLLGDSVEANKDWVSASKRTSDKLRYYHDYSKVWR